jgi:hypothetical protein
MGDRATMFTSQASREEAEKLFESKLAELGLSEKQIESQELPELQVSLVRIDELIANPDAFATVKYPFVTGSPVEFVGAQFELGPLAFLLARRRSILERIGSLKTQHNVENIKAMAAQIPAESRTGFQQKLDDLQADVNNWQRQALSAEEALRRAESSRQKELLRIEWFTRRSEVLRSFLERQSVATILGAILLLLMFLVIALNASTNTPTPQLITNAFLVILGYFFGQSGGTPRGDAATRKSDSSTRFVN